MDEVPLGLVESCDCSLNALEHFGLGRYSDLICWDGRRFTFDFPESFDSICSLEKPLHTLKSSFLVLLLWALIPQS